MDCGLCLLEDFALIEGFVEEVILLHLAVGADIGAELRFVEQLAVVESFGFPVIDGVAHFEFVDAANHLIDGAEPKLCHQFADFFGDVVHEVHHGVGATHEFLAQLGVLGRDSNGAGVFVAHAHHEATEGYQRGGGKTEFLGTEEAGDRDIAPGLELPVGFNNNAGAKVVEQEGLVGFSESEFPGSTGVLNGRTRGGSGATIVTGNEDDVCFRFGDPGGNGSNTDLRNEFHVDTGVLVGIFEVMDEFGKVLDGINIVVGRGRDEPHAGSGTTGLGDLWEHLVSG